MVEPWLTMTVAAVEGAGEAAEAHFVFACLSHFSVLGEMGISLLAWC